MKSMIHTLNTKVWPLCLLMLAAFLPALAQAQPLDDNQPVTAVTTDASGTILVLRGGSLVAIEDGTAAVIPLPASDGQPTSLARGADGDVYLGGPGMGVWRYDNASGDWQSLNESLPDLSVNAIAAHANQPGTLYAYSEQNGMFRSRDRGTEWARVDGGPREPVQTFLHSDMPGSMESGWLFAGTTRGVARSMDCFCFWGDAGELRGTVSAISYDPAAPENVYAVIEGVLHHSADGGEAWEALDVPQPVTALAFSPEKGLVAGTVDGDLLARGSAGEWTPVHD
ncbi:hypothetical protein SAMN05216203_0363 [Marinobacter daqiaonensis]|uniref:Photosynthesis system II assembly factor Ycf48/Hcf136-like domain-containing protein n=1 Tax=Marinobacter daqiaonensis TaxID=650891 RepID=A0A1I6GQ52_9GAMM|nr:hypothetical protein [Marinobacter daqiaonensis]SFR44308.1 hypothetical protein SAMN05216203_0363 [Marinobacter daqiaonensis]